MLATEEFWGVAHVATSQERRAVENLRRQAFEVFFPFFIHQNPGRSPSPQPLFPGYVFVRLDFGMPWGAINSTYGVIRLLASPSGVPQRLATAFIASVRRCLVPDPSAVRQSTHQVISSGTHVRILRGPFAGHEAVVQWSRERRLGLLFSLFNREIEAEFQSSDVEVVS